MRDGRTCESWSRRTLEIERHCCNLLPLSRTSRRLRPSVVREISSIYSFTSLCIVYVHLQALSAERSRLYCDTSESIFLKCLAPTKTECTPRASQPAPLQGKTQPSRDPGRRAALRGRGHRRTRPRKRAEHAGARSSGASSVETSQIAIFESGGNRLQPNVSPIRIALRFLLVVQHVGAAD